MCSVLKYLLVEHRLVLSGCLICDCFVEYSLEISGAHYDWCAHVNSGNGNLLHFICSLNIFSLHSIKSPKSGSLQCFKLFFALVLTLHLFRSLSTFLPSVWIIKNIKKIQRTTKTLDFYHHYCICYRFEHGRFSSYQNLDLLKLEHSELQMYYIKLENRILFVSVVDISKNFQLSWNFRIMFKITRPKNNKNGEKLTEAHWLLIDDLEHIVCRAWFFCCKELIKIQIQIEWEIVFKWLQFIVWKVRQK